MAREGALPSDLSGERGSALVLAILVSVILTLLGVTFLMIADTENLIAENERRTAQALYLGEAGARTVKRWFDHPDTALGIPAIGNMTLTDRRIIDESDPHDPLLLMVADGLAVPYYKAEVAANLFERPYRGSLADTLLGTEEFPDIRIDEEQHQAYLNALSVELMADFPAAENGVIGRISSIEIYAPPYLHLTPAAWTRFGVGTVKVIARIYKNDQVLGERMVKAVINEIPYSEAFGPLHSCGRLKYEGPLNVHWGVVTAKGATTISNNFNDLHRSLPRRSQGVSQIDPLWLDGYQSTLAEYVEHGADGSAIEDPWFRLISGGALDGPAPEAVGQHPYPGLWKDWNFGAGDPPPANCCDYSGVFQNLPAALCPDYEYALWKTVAASGARDVRYFVWDPDTDTFSENGRGAGQSFYDLTNGKQGLYFFDTRDRLPPADEDGDGVRDDNLTPAIQVTQDWIFEGMIYLNAIRFETGDINGKATTLNPPGEPFVDTNADARHQIGEPFVSLDYQAGPAFVIDFADAGGYTARGPDVPDVDVAFRGVLYLSGSFVAEGTAGYYGTVIARLGVEQASTPGPDIWWDQSIAGGFPPAGLDLPRVFITSWVPTL